MISHLSHSTVFVLDQDSAKAFYTEMLGFELRYDITMREEFEGAGGGFRWLTVGAKDQPDLQLILSSCDMGRSPEAAEQLRTLVASGGMGGCGRHGDRRLRSDVQGALVQGCDVPVGAGGAAVRHRGDDARRLGQPHQPHPALRVRPRGHVELLRRGPWPAVDASAHRRPRTVAEALATPTHRA